MASSEHRVVVGLGTTGLSCARYLHQRGLPFSVVDTRAQPPGLAQLQSEMPHVAVYSGEYPRELIAAASELIVSPGIAMDAPMVADALAAGVGGPVVRGGASHQVGHVFDSAPGDCPVAVSAL